MKPYALAVVASLSAFTLLAGTSSASAESWPSLKEFVGECVLIVKARTVVEKDGTLSFQVLESWKGTYDPKLFLRTTADGRFFANEGEHGVDDVAAGQEIVFFFTRRNQPVEGKLSRHSTAFPVRKGKVVYAPTDPLNHRKEYTLEAFKKAVLDLAALKPPLPRGNASLPELAKTCKGALVATLVAVSEPRLGPPGAADYTSKWKVRKVLRGDYPETVELSFRVQSLPQESRERPPDVGRTYILISYEKNREQVAAILEADEASVRKVQDLLGR